ncbi:FAD-dependent oxidoreductase [Thermomonas sp.]|uniref:FAD-dependent oxidoreductase n=1 Tax=Thermomonas sp. TaxID=1971895 RepID=UPI002487FDEA|nr:FAD-dependent oxidoreductase [Thermomonas sp.]MDI1252247.1 FAD-dependent oxidoreductase [Thermomonas sp.]
MSQPTAISGPDFGQGIPLSNIPDEGVLAGHVNDTPVLLARVAGELHAVSATCTHYGAPLAEGLRVGDEIRCPWHHACFSLRTGEALHAPAFAALATWRVETVGAQVFVHPASTETPAIVRDASQPCPHHPGRIVLVGGGATAFAAAERLRSRGFAGSLSMLSADSDPPCDRPNLSKDYLAGTASEDWIPLQSADFYTEHAIDLRVGCEVTAIDLAAHSVTTQDGNVFEYDALLLAQGAEPIRLHLPGFDHPNVHILRSLADARALIAGVAEAASVAVIGAGFIGLEAASALRTRGLEVHVIAPEALPLDKLLGEALASHVVGLHRAQGVVFHPGCQASAFENGELLLSDGQRLAVDAVLVGVGVKPRMALAEAAGLTVDNGIVVDDCLRASAPGVFAAGDVARYPHADGSARVEHWVHAERQGQVAADNMLGAAQAYTAPPFFWTHHFGTDVRYVGHGRGWTSVEVDGSPADGDCLVRYFRDGTLVAAASIGRDQALLEIEEAMSR